jgi:hypothetical protein
MRPTDLVDDRELKPVKFGGRRKKGAPVLRVVRTRTGARLFHGGIAGTAVGLAVARLTGEPMTMLATAGLGAALGGVFGSRERDDFCATCEASLKVEAVECTQCDAPIGGEIKSRKERAAGEEQLRLARVAARKRAEAEGKTYEGDKDDDSEGPLSL